jgi:hypothetical protein
MDQGPAKEDIAREEGERNSLHPVFPMVSGRIEGKEGFKSFPHQDSMNDLFVLMASVKSVPTRSCINVSHRCLSVHHEPIRSPAWLMEIYSADTHRLDFGGKIMTNIAEILRIAWQQSAQ